MRDAEHTEERAEKNTGECWSTTSASATRPSTGCELRCLDDAAAVKAWARAQARRVAQIPPSRTTCSGPSTGASSPTGPPLRAGWGSRGPG